MIVSSVIMPYAHCMRKFVPLILLVTALLLTGCQVTEDLTMDTSQSGRSFTAIHVEQFFIDVLEDFAEFLPENNESMMDSAIRGYASELEGTEAISDVSWASLGDNKYTVSFSFSGISELLEEMGAENQSLFTLSENSMSFYLDINNYPELKAVVPFLADQNFEVYGPEYNQGMSEADYLDMIYFLLGEDGPEAITNGVININIEVPGNVVSTAGCTQTGDSSVSYTFPIIDFLLLGEPLAFTVEWE